MGSLPVEAAFSAVWEVQTDRVGAEFPEIERRVPGRLLLAAVAVLRDEVPVEHDRLRAVALDLDHGR
jgi:hypothetical protein